MVGAAVLADVLDVSSPREVVLELMERTGHDSVCQVEGLLHAVSVVDVDVDVQHSLVGLQQLQNGQDAVIHVTEP